MTQFSCNYGDGRDEAIVASLYDEPDAGAAAQPGFDAHLQTCARCQADIAALRSVRTQLARWSPPEPSFTLHHSQPVDDGPRAGVQNPSWWRTIPAWAQVAAALLVLGVSAGLANLDVRYDQSGLTMKTGWSQRSGTSRPSDAVVAGVSRVAQPAGEANAPWHADLAALERQMKSEIHAAQVSAAATSMASRSVPASASDAEVTRRVRAIIEESEKRQQRELALRLAELARDVTSQRQADMMKIDRTLGLVQNNVGIEVMKNREKLNQMDLIYRASQRQ